MTEKTSIMLGAFQDELEKIAITRPDLMESPPELKGNARYLSSTLADSRGMAHTPGRDVIQLPPADYYNSSMTPRLADLENRVLKRHEMIHWNNRQKGRFLRAGTPGVRGVLHTIGDEATAYIGGAKKYFRAMDHLEGPELMRAAMHAGTTLAGGVPGSLRTSYPQGVGKALLGGTIGRTIGRIRKLVGR
jgi:hypothetical protein